MTLSKRALVFAPCAFNLAETSRMVEIGKAVARDPLASTVFDIHFISDGGEFESMIEKHGFALTRMEPRLTQEKIQHIAKVDRGEKFEPAYTDAEMIQRVQNEIAVLKRLDPGAVVTGSYASIPVTCRVLISTSWLSRMACASRKTQSHSSSGPSDGSRNRPVAYRPDDLSESFWTRTPDLLKRRLVDFVYVSGCRYEASHCSTSFVC